MLKEYFLKCVCIWIIVVKYEGILNSISVKCQIEESSLGRKEISHLTNRAHDFVSRRMPHNTLGRIYASKYNSKIRNTNSKTVINFIVNINVFNKQYTGKIPKRFRRKRNSRNPKRKKRFTKLKKIHENVGSQRSKLDLKVSSETNENFPNITSNDDFNHNVIRSTKILPKLVNRRQVTIASKLLKKWEEILALDPVLSTERPTQPEVGYIDEWKYSYRVTFYEPGNYNVNYTCSGILVAPQWVLTSLYCSLGDNVVMIIGVYSLPKIILDHNKYTVHKRIYSLKENLVLIEMDRPVEWKFDAPDIRALKWDELSTLLKNRKCTVLSWIPVDMRKQRFELREYPRLKFRRRNNSTERFQKNSIEVEPPPIYSLCENDLGSPVLCEGVISGIILNVQEDCKSNMTVKLLCPVLEWITVFTKEKSYFEVSARKWPPTNFSQRPVHPVYAIIFIVIVLFCK